LTKEGIGATLKRDMALIVQRRADPFKKYWWLILLLFGAIGLWISYPALGGNSGLSLANAGKGLRPATQSLDPSGNPNGAPGGPVNLSMSAYGKQSIIDPFASLLFSPPASLKIAVAPQAVGKAAKKSSSWADTLANIAAGGNSASADTAGFKTQAAFPHGSFGNLSGLSGSEASSAFSGAGSGANLHGMGGFGSHKPDISMSYTHGLSNSDSSSSDGSSMGALQNAAKKMKAAANASNTSAAGAMTSQIFDNGAMGNGLIGDPKGMATGAGIQISNGTPLNLKAADPKPSSSQPSPVPVTPPLPPPQTLADQIIQMVMIASVGGVMSAASTGLVALL